MDLSADCTKPCFSPWSQRRKANWRQKCPGVWGFFLSLHCPTDKPEKTGLKFFAKLNSTAQMPTQEETPHLLCIRMNTNKLYNQLKNMGDLWRGLISSLPAPPQLQSKEMQSQPGQQLPPGSYLGPHQSQLHSCSRLLRAQNNSMTYQCIIRNARKTHLLPSRSSTNTAGR